MMKEESQEPAAATAAGEKATERGASAPFGKLSMLAVQEALQEIGAQARQSTANSQAAFQRIWHAAEKQFGIEVEMEDPALRELFRGCICVETILGQIRQQANTLANASEQLLRAPSVPLRQGLMSLCGDESAIPQSFVKLGAEQEESHNHLMERLRLEVFDRIEKQIAKHEAVRDEARERQRWHLTLDSHRSELVALKQRPVGSGLRNVDGNDKAKRIEELQEKMNASMARVAALDQSVLETLLELQRSACEAVRWPWAALLQIQAEFYATQAKQWSPLADSIGETLASLPSAGTTSSAESSSAN